MTTKPRVFENSVSSTAFFCWFKPLHSDTAFNAIINEVFDEVFRCRKSTGVTDADFSFP